MSLQSIAQTLYTQATTNGQVTIDDNLLGTGSTAFATLVQSSLMRSAGNVILSAAAANIPQNPTGTSFSFTAAMPTAEANSFLHLNANTTTVVISQQGTAFQVQITIQLATGATPAWVLSTSFDDMLGWPFDSLPVTQPVFIFIYGNQDLAKETHQGLNYSATPALTGILGPAAAFLKLFGHDSPDMSPWTGVISQTTNGTVFMLSSSFTSVTNIDLKALTLNSLTVKALFGYSEPVAGSGMIPEGWGQIVLMAETTLAGQPYPIDVSLALPYSDSASFMSLIIAPPPGSLATSLASIGQWMAGKSWDSFFAQAPANQLTQYLNTFGLRSYTLSFSLSPFSVMSSTLSVGTLTPWPIIPGKLVMRDFFVTWQLIDPAHGAYHSISINGILDMFGRNGEKITFTGSILLPDLQLSLALSSDTALTGAQWLQTIVTAFGGEPVAQYILDALSGFELKMVMFNMNVPEKDFTYQMVGAIGVGGNKVDFNFYVHLNISGATVYDIKTEFVFASVSVMGEITNDNPLKQTIITGSWQDPVNPLGLNAIAAALGYNDLGIPPELDLGLKEVDLSYNLATSTLGIAAKSANYGNADLLVFKQANDSSFTFFGGLIVNKPIDLTNLKLIGKALSALETVEIRDLQVLISSKPIKKDQISNLNAILNALSSGLPVIPPEGMASTVSISMNFDIGGFIIPIGTGIGGTSMEAGMPASKSSVQGTPTGNLAAPVPSVPGSQSDGVSWFNLQKAVGPIMFRRIGIKYKDSVLWFLLDASFSAGGLTIDLLGAGIGSPLNTFEPNFTIEGLGIDFSEPGLELGGTFINIPPGPGLDWEYAGGAIIKTGSFSLSAVGSYASMSGTPPVPSMFVFAQVTGTFGGPPPFFVTGLAGGFGYNSSLRLPAMNEIYQFPLVAGAQNPNVIGGKSPSPAEVLAILMGRSGGGQPWITHEIGQYWFAAGIQFSTYSIVKSNALLVIEFGKHLQFALLGLSRARFPMDGPKMYAFLELQLEVLIDPTVGIFALSAIVSPNSFVLDPSCRITGGFAFYYWFEPNTHAGDFVITVGGYHPHFDPADWYPQIARVGFSWSLDSTISITGGAYFAMTPSAAMAGGKLSATYQKGGLKAWFTAWADMLVYWNPFQFDVYFGVSVGASYTANLLLTTSTLEVELGASLHLWGPPTGGSVTVHWWVISFTIDFGELPLKKQPTLVWTEFQTQLPAPASTVKIVPVEGLVPNGETDLNSGRAWSVRPSGFTFNTESAIPSSSLLLGTSGTELATVVSINIRPMQATGLISTQKLVLKRNGIEINTQNENWKITNRQQDVARAMWGTGPQDQMDPGNAQLVENQLVGFLVETPSPSLGTTPGIINVAQNLPYNVLTPQGQFPIVPGEPSRGPVAQTSTQTIHFIKEQIDLPSYIQARNNLYDALANLGIQLEPETKSDMSLYASYAGGLFADEPLLIPQS